MTPTTDTPRTDAMTMQLARFEVPETPHARSYCRDPQADRIKEPEYAGMTRILPAYWNNEALDKTLSELAASKAEVERLKAEVERLTNGFQGSCYCCEPVGEMNQKLEAEVERFKEEVISAQESEAVWKTERDKADQRRLEAEAEVEKLATKYFDMESACAYHMAEVERLNGLLSDLLILTEKIYWNSNNYKMIKEAHRDYK